MSAPAARTQVEPARPSSGGHVRRDVLEDTRAPLAAPLVPITAPLVPATAPLAPHAGPPRSATTPGRPAGGDDDEADEGELDRAYDDGAAIVSGTGATSPPPPGAGTGARLQRSSLPELFKAMTTKDRGEDGGLLVDAATEKLTDGQMHKDEFMKSLRAEVHRTADEELSTLGRSSAACPYIDEMLHRYDRRTAAEVERAVRRYAPEARDVDNAADYIPYVSARIARGIKRWIETRKMPDDLPSEEVQGMATAGGWIGAAAGLAGIAPPKEDNDKADQPQRMASGPFAGRVDGRALVARLGPGRSLDGHVRGRMERALGHSFAAVRIHADDRAAALNRDLAARAFTIGPHVAFGAGAPVPGTIEGDALLAHELAHVVQQGASSPRGEVPIGAPGDTLEHDADAAAERAVGLLHGGLDDDERDAPAPAPAPAGLRLQRCTPTPPPKAPSTTPPAQVDPARQTYDQALERLKTSAPELQRVLANVPLAASDTDSTRVRTTTFKDPDGNAELRFDLHVALVDALDGTTLARFRNPPAEKVERNLSTPPFFMRFPMRIDVSRAAARSAEDLEANLYHEGIHMFLFMDRWTQAAAEQSSFTPTYNTYAKLARDSAEFGPLRQRIVEAAGSSNGADELVLSFVEEKLAYDSAGAKYGEKYHNSNAEIARDYVPDLISDHGWTVSDDVRREMIQRVTKMLDDIDAARSKTAYAPPTMGHPREPMPPRELS